MASSDLRGDLPCCICSFVHHVTLRCGHTLCRVCNDLFLPTQKSGVYSCPTCKEKFLECPAMIQNVSLQKVTENILSTQPHQEEVAGIFCTYCIHSPVPVVKSCLHCEASLCDNHLRGHSKEAEHVLTDPSISLEKRKCSIHKEPLKYYCTKDAMCICVSCSLAGEHRGHRVEMLDKASEKKKEKMRGVLQKLITKTDETEERVQSLEERRRKAQEEAAGEAERVTALFIDIRRRLDDLEKRVLSEISRQVEQFSHSLSDAIEELKIKKDMLRHIEKLCNMTDPLTVLQDPDTGDLCNPEEEGGDEDTGGHDGGDEDTGGHKTHDVDDLDVTVISDTFRTLCDIISGIRSGIYVEGPVDILLDVNTAENSLLISDDLKTVTRTDINQNHPETAERFQEYAQVMSRRRFTSGRHFWDVEISRSGLWIVGMCYPSIDRRGGQSFIGDNNKSWCLWGGKKCSSQYSVIHDSKVIQLPHQMSSDRVRICLDYGAGQLSFYELCDPIRHLHTFTTTFTEPLHAVLHVYDGYIKILGGEAAEKKVGM